MTSDWLAGLKALEAAASPGPWKGSWDIFQNQLEAAQAIVEVIHKTPGKHFYIVELDDGSKRFAALTGNGPTSGANAEFIVNARNIFPELLAVINEARLLDQCALGSWECNCQNCRTLRAIDALAGKVVVK